VPNVGKAGRIETQTATGAAHGLVERGSGRVVLRPQRLPETLLIDTVGVKREEDHQFGASPAIDRAGAAEYFDPAEDANKNVAFREGRRAVGVVGDRETWRRHGLAKVDGVRLTAVDIGSCGEKTGRREEDVLRQRSGLQPETERLDDQGVVLDTEFAVGCGNISRQDDRNPGVLCRGVD